MFGFAGVLVTMLPRIKVEQSKGMPFKRIVRFTIHEILANWKLIRSNHNLSFPILQLTITQTMLGVIMALAPALSIAILGLPLQHSSHFLIIPAGLGMVAGVVLIDRITPYLRPIKLIAVGIIAAAVALILVGLSTRLHEVLHIPFHLHATIRGYSIIPHYQIGLIVAPLVFILGFMNAVVSVAAQTILQHNTTDASRGKVFGALGMMTNIAATLPIFFAGILADLTSVQTVITSLGIFLLGFGAWQYVALSRRGVLQKS